MIRDETVTLMSQFRCIIISIRHKILGFISYKIIRCHLVPVEINNERHRSKTIAHGKIDFAEVSKNLARYKSKNNFWSIQNNM